jgi:phage terminase large subunit-like protein
MPQQQSNEALVELARRELSRRHLLEYVKYMFQGYDASWHHKYMCEKLEQVEAGTIKRLMLFLPPRHGKSELGSVQFPAWYLGRNPSKEIINCSYTADLATDFGRRVRNAVSSENYKNVFTTSLSVDSTASNKWHTTQEGSYISTGVGGPLTGRGADVLLIDDPFKNRQEADSPIIREQVWNWYISTAYTRLSPQGAVILIMTRWHDDDLAGRLLHEKQKGADQWEVISFPAIATQDDKVDGQVVRKVGEALWPTRFSLERLMATKAVLGSYDWSSLYQQSPLDESSIEFKKEWMKERTEDEVDKLNTRRFLTVDTAGPMTSTSDYTGWVDNRVDMEGNWNLIAKKYKMTSADLVEMIFLAHDKYHYEKIGIEKTIYLDSLKPFLDLEMMKRKKMLPIVELKHGGRSKELRIRGLLPRYQAGRVFHVKDQCDDLIPQLLRFPKSAEDDVMDAAAYQDQVAEAPFGWGKDEFALRDGTGVSSKTEAFDKFNPMGTF